jgi:hypothetical protein
MEGYPGDLEGNPGKAKGWLERFNNIAIYY